MKEPTNGIDNETIKFWQGRLTFLLGHEKELERILERNLKSDDDLERKNVRFNIRSLCKARIEIKFYEILLQTKNYGDGFAYKKDHSNWTNIEQEIREKFNISDSIQEPIFIKEGLEGKNEKEYEGGLDEERVSESFSDQEWKDYQGKLKDYYPLNDKEWRLFQKEVQEQNSQMTIGVNFFPKTIIVGKDWYSTRPIPKPNIEHPKVNLERARPFIPSEPYYGYGDKGKPKPIIRVKSQHTPVKYDSEGLPLRERVKMLMGFICFYLLLALLLQVIIALIFIQR